MTSRSHPPPVPGIYHATKHQLASFCVREAVDPTAQRLVDLSGCADLHQILREFGRQLQFPDWYGNNLDALVDCLCDTDCLDGTIKLIALKGLNACCQNKNEQCEQLLSAIHAAIAERSDQGEPLWVFSLDRVQGLQDLPAQ